LGPDGSLYAATLPSGRVFKLKSDAATKQDDSTAALVFDPAKLDSTSSADSKFTATKPSASAHYIWDLTFDQSGRLYIAAGGPAAIYRVDPSKPLSKPELFFKSDEAHIRSLAWDAKGNLIAGSDGSGLVYRISPEGKGYVLFDAPRREITAVAVSAKGTIYAASVGDKSRNALPPLPVQGIGTATITIVQPQSLEQSIQAPPCPKEPKSTPSTKARPAQTLVQQGRHRLRLGRAPPMVCSPSPATADTSSAFKTMAATPTLHTLKRSKA